MSLEFAVRDSGIGIPREKQEEIFLPFHQVDNSYTRRFGGTGLGLSICQQLASLLNGRLKLESELGHGSTFYLTVPFLKVAAGQGGTVVAESEPAQLQLLT